MTELIQKPRWPCIRCHARCIGAAIALELATRGYQVIGTATSDSGAERIAQALAAFPGCRV